MRKNNIYYIYAFLIIMFLVLSLFLEDKIGSRIITVVTVSTAALGAISIFIQYKRDKDVNQATFTLEYAKYFHSLNKVEEVMAALDDYRLGKRDSLEKINYQGLVNYLVWCEELATLYQKNVIDIESVDNIFSYTFFLVTNNKYVQEKELCPQAEFYKGIFYLHKKWTDYKKATNQPIINEKESLDKVKDYLLYTKKGDQDNREYF